MTGAVTFLMEWPRVNDSNRFSTIPLAPAGLEKSGLLVAPQLIQDWGSDLPNLEPPIL
jgi:hypothetical protein